MKVSDLKSGFNGRISIIIPSYIDATGCFKVLEGLVSQTLSASEVLLVRSGNWDDSGAFWSDWVHRFSLRDTLFRVIYSPTRLMPGSARNFGLRFAKGDWIAFLDVQTVPKQDWLESQLKLISELRTVGSYGATYYVANNCKVAVIRDAIYGHLPVRTIPGAVLHRSVFNKVGQFIPSVRAAEDTEWMIRADLMRLNIFKKHARSSTDYYGLTSLGLMEIQKKWQRNYKSSRDLQHLKVQRALLWLVGYSLLSLFAFNWNALVAGWQMDSPYYIDHVTKIASLSPVVLYIFVRGICIPFKRGVPLRSLFPLRFLLLSCVGGLLDLTKAGAVIVPRSPRGSTAID